MVSEIVEARTGDDLHTCPGVSKRPARRVSDDCIWHPSGGHPIAFEYATVPQEIDQIRAILRSPVAPAGPLISDEPAKVRDRICASTRAQIPLRFGPLQEQGRSAHSPDRIPVGSVALSRIAWQLPAHFWLIWTWNLQRGWAISLFWPRFAWCCSEILVRADASLEASGQSS
jgi:hypothetical protein